MMKRGLMRSGRLMLAVGVLLMGLTGCTTTGHAPAFPPEIHGWTPAEPDQTFTIDTLYDYIDGSAEVYRALNVKSVYARRYAKEGAQDIIADVFDMGSSYDAYGAYHHDIREGEPAGIGQESELQGATLSFWKDRFFICIIPFDDTPELREAVRTIAESISEEIANEGAVPPLVALLPSDGLVRSQVHYFHTHLALNTHYFVATENILDLDLSTNGVFARYQRGGTDAPPLGFALLQYPSADRADKAFKSFMEAYLPDADAEGMAKTENNLWTGACVHGAHIIAVFDAPSKADAETLIAQVELNHRRK